MATKARRAVAQKNRALANSANRCLALVPEEFAEFMASLEEDEAFADAANRNDCDPEYND